MDDAEIIEEFLQLLKNRIQEISDPYMRGTLLLAYQVGAFTGILLIMLILLPAIPILWAGHKAWEAWRRRF